MFQIEDIYTLELCSFPINTSNRTPDTCEKWTCKDLEVPLGGKRCKTAIVSYSLLQHNNPYTMQITQSPPKRLPRTLIKQKTRRSSQLFRNCNNPLWSKLRFHENQLDCHRRKNLIENTVIKLKFRRDIFDS